MADIAILYGGRSGEHEVSRRSAASVLENIPARHTVLLIGIDHRGGWYRQDVPSPVPESLDIASDEKKRIAVKPGGGLIDAGGALLPVDAVLPILHGSYGEDGTLQGLLEMADIPYAGSGVLGSALSMDKDLAKKVWSRAGLPVVPWRTLRPAAMDAKDPALAGELFRELGPVLFVKPANAGSSVGVSRVERPEDLGDALTRAALHDRKVLVEQAVEGREIECSVMGYAEPTAFPPGEVVPAGKHSFYDYDAKYIDPDGALLRVPADLPQETAQRIRTLAEQAYAAVDAGGFSRVDFLLEKNGEGLFINEINTIPGMTSISLFPRMTASGGLDFTAMLEKLIDGALEEAAYRNSRSYDR